MKSLQSIYGVDHVVWYEVRPLRVSSFLMSDLAVK